MVTFHPSASKVRQPDGSILFRPMVMVRNPAGQMIGSRVSSVDTYSTKDDARNQARLAAHSVAAKLQFCRVA